MPVNPIFTNPNNALLQDRLARVQNTVRNLVYYTAEDYQAAVTSAINSVLSLGYAMTSLAPVIVEGPALAGDAGANFTILNNDAQDIENEILRIENSSASLFNLAAASQNQLRQAIREQAYGSNNKRYVEDFLNSDNLPGSTASFDFNAGLATSTLLDSTQVTPLVTIGSNSVGSLNPNSALANLTDGKIDTNMEFDGSSLELILTFPSTTIVNRLEIDLDTYLGLKITSLTTTPDGNLVQDILGDLGITSFLMDSTSSKFTGDVILDFPPRYVLNMRIVIEDVTGADVLALRQLSLFAQRYGPTAQLTTGPISKPSSTVAFSCISNVFNPYVSITHQLSYNGTEFTTINPGSITLTGNTYWYRALFGRSSTAFTNATAPLSQSALDMVPSANYTLTSTTTIPLGSNAVERTMTIINITGPIVFQEIPLSGTLQVQTGSVLLNKDNGDYTFYQQALAFPTIQSSITVTYQTTAGSVALQNLEDYYSGLLYEFRFDQS